MNTSSARDRNRKIRQEALREQLAEQCRFQHIIDNIKKIEQLDPSEEDFANKLAQLKAANEQRLKVSERYLAPLKSTEVIGEIEHSHNHTIVSDQTRSVLEQIAGLGEDTSDKTPLSH